MGHCSNTPMFIYITWKNKGGKELKTMVDHSKVQTFISAMVERGVEPEVFLPEEVNFQPRSVAPLHIS